jgi:threonine/homoserine/homoserine lactone efflux protein
MLYALFFIKSLFVGIAVAAPLGPAGILCLRYIINQGFWVGLVSGLGVATADTIYAAVAALGLTYIADFVIAYQFWLRFIGGVALILIGIKIFRVHSETPISKSNNTDFFHVFLSGFLFTIANPFMILILTAVFAAVGLASVGTNYDLALTVILGVLTGSSLWWLSLSGGISLFRRKFTESIIRLTNRISGIMIVLLGIYSFLTMFRLIE